VIHRNCDGNTANVRILAMCAPTHPPMQIINKISWIYCNKVHKFLQDVEGSSRVSQWVAYRFVDCRNRCKMPEQKMKAGNANLSPCLATKTGCYGNGPWQKYTEFSDIVIIFFIDCVNAIIRVAICLPTVEWEGRHLKTIVGKT